MPLDRDVDLRHVDRLFAPGDQVVVAGDVGAVVADVAEEGPERPVVVEAQRQGADRPSGVRSWIDMSMAMPSSGWIGPCTAWAICDVARRSGTGTGRRCARRGARAGGRSSCAAGRARSCSCAGRSRSARPSAGCDSSPAPIRWWIHWCDGLKRRVCPTMQTRPVSCCTRSTACASAQLSASGISTCTCLPARIAAIACAACSCVGVQRMTASTSSRASTSARSVVACSMPYFARDLLRPARAGG